MTYTLPEKRGNPFYPLPADYDRLASDDARKEARMALLTGWWDRSKPKQLIVDQKVFREAFRFFVDVYVKPSHVMNNPLPLFDLPDCRWIPYWIRLMQHPLVALMGFRGSSKTVHLVRVLPEFVSLCRPGTKISISEYNKKRTDEEVDPIVSDLEENELFLEEFGSMRPPKYGRYKWSTGQLDLLNGSQIRGVSIKSSQRGRHPDLLIQDDVEKDEEAANDEFRAKFLNYILKVIMGMLRPGAHLIWPGTYTHPGSCLMSFVQKLIPEAENWRTLECPLILRETLCKVCGRRKLEDIEADVRMECDRCKEKLIYERESASFGPNPISMWPEMYSVEDAELLLSGKGTADGRVKGMGPGAFWMEMMGKVHRGGNQMFARNDIGNGYRIISTAEGRIVELLRDRKRMPYNEWFDTLHVVMGVDIAYSEANEADYSAIVVGGADPFGRFFVLDAWQDRVSPTGLIEAARNIATRWRCQLIGWESVAASLEMAARARRELKDIANVKPLIHSGARHNKVLRIRNLQIPVAHREILFPVFREIDGQDAMGHANARFINALTAQMDRYSNSGKGTTHDDLLDACEMAYTVNAGFRPNAPVNMTEAEESLAELKAAGIKFEKALIPPEGWTRDMWLEARGLKKIKQPMHGRRSRNIWR